MSGRFVEFPKKELFMVQEVFALNFAHKNAAALRL